MASRVRPGRSGNPGGRPKGPRNRSRPPALNEERPKSVILEEAHRTISVNDADGQITIPMAQAVARSLAVDTAEGNQRARRLFTDPLAGTERERKLRKLLTRLIPDRPASTLAQPASTTAPKR